MWNSVAQKMNPSQIHLLRSKDNFSEVDDPKGHVKKMLSSTMLNGFRKVGIPDHELLLKVDDICLVTRPFHLPFDSAIPSAVPPFPPLLLLRLAEELHQQCDSAACMLASAISFSLQLT
jgi:hypothetical protein